MNPIEGDEVNAPASRHRYIITEALLKLERACRENDRAKMDDALEDLDKCREDAKKDGH